MEMRSGPPARNLRKRKLSELEWVAGQPQQASKRRQLEVSDLLEYLDSQQHMNIKQGAAKVTKPKGPKLIHQHSIDMMAFVIFLRFNSLTSDAQVARSCREIFEITGVKPSTQANMFARWRKCGYRIFNGNLGNGRRRKTTPEQEEWICNVKTLQEMAHLPLVVRAEIIRKKFNFETYHLTSLHMLYRRNGVRLARPQYHYARKLAQQEAITASQKKVSTEITEAMMANKHIIYIDESSFHQWMVPSRAWVKPNMSIQMPSSRGCSFSIIAAISEQKGLLLAKVFKGSNDSNVFFEFVHQLVQKIKGEAIVYMDNYTVHHAKKVKEIFNARVVQRFFPPYSCVLNPIEKLWHVIKNQWKRKMLQHPDGLAEDEMKKELETILGNITDE